MARTPKAPPYLAVGERIKTIRLRERLTQADMAKRVGTSSAHYWRIESGRFPPPTEILQNIQTEFGVTPNEIMLGTREVMDRAYERAMREVPEPALNWLRWLAGWLISDDKIRDRFVEFCRRIEQEMKPGTTPLTGAQRDVLERVERGFAENWLDWVALSRFVHEAESRVPTAGTSYTPPKIAVRAAEIAAEEAAKYGAGRLEQRLSRRKTGLVPLVRIAAGMAIEALDATETGDYVTPPPWLEEEKIDAALRVVGDSMTEEGLRHDDIVFVRRKAWSSGGIAVARRRSTNEITLKQVFSRGAELELRSASERDIAPMRWPADDSELTGVEVVGMWRPSWHGSDDPHPSKS